MSNKTLDNIKTLLLDLDAKISHIEDMEADNRTIIIKLVKQNNQIVEFLKQLEVDIYEGEELISSSDFLKSDDLSSAKLKDVKKLVESYREKSESLQELEKELKELKDQITPGQIGEA
tara:strand:+ start:134 stop:487 length:354 start_codon:yes stop_codon:yes gene_type:complete